MPDLRGRTLGGYCLLSLVGQGGMATVYLARSLDDGRQVAIKILGHPVAENESFLHRFRREAKVLSRLSHPNIVPLEGFEESEGIAFLAMPYIAGGSLADRMTRGPLHPREGGQIVEDICAALQHAHDRQIVHRDVKPSNILLANDGRAMLSDFGLAQIHDASMSLTGSALLGTPSYASPEQARGDPATGLSDQYSLGIVLFEMTTGSLPFEAETPLAVLLKHASDPTPAPRTVNENIPVAVERVIQRATSKRPEDRFPTISELNRSFQAALAHALDPLENPEPTIPLPEVQRRSQVLRKEQGRRRRRALLAAAGAVVALVLCGAAAFLTGLLGAPKAQAESAQITSLAGTIEALSVSLASAQGGTLEPRELAAAVLGTLAAGDKTPEPTALALALGIGVVPTPSPAPLSATLAGRGGPTFSGIPTWTLGSGTQPPTSAVSVTSYVSATSASIPTTTLPASSTPILPPTATHTPPPTATAPPPTSTSPPPTSTSPPSPCSLTQHVGTSRSGQEYVFVLRNNGSSPYTITQMSLSWPTGNGELKKVELDGEEIWDGELGTPTTITSWKSGSDRDIYPGGNRDLVLFFEDDAAASGYNLSITLESACALPVSS